MHNRWLGEVGDVEGGGGGGAASRLGRTLSCGPFVPFAFWWWCTGDFSARHIDSRVRVLQVSSSYVLLVFYCCLEERLDLFLVPHSTQRRHIALIRACERQLARCVGC